jgi:hypothetical protein
MESRRCFVLTFDLESAEVRDVNEIPCCPSEVGWNLQTPVVLIERSVAAVLVNPPTERPTNDGSSLLGLPPVNVIPRIVLAF